MELKFSYETFRLSDPSHESQNRCCIVCLILPDLACRAHKNSHVRNRHITNLFSRFPCFAKQENVVTGHSEQYTSSPRDRRSGLFSRRTPSHHRQNIPKRGNFSSHMGSRCTVPPRHFHRQICNFSHLTLNQILTLFGIEE
jgi:hypothetical protein